ncbi:MAG TPA: peptidylprolyl isomerase [Cyclobacteriaceae bacterium]|nr:peptidylprolyl isomerase [Cyclobacteriaceae bacterium]HMV07615.1 peptidylprolyl isomerase [Cyclobacteriaceae bacterium]HMV89344.1 peptidylprolyl isomerase [Cyclobacteriaceae bacterium]HMW98750.1 peptidylprolyl isomerase [Cyclobacteriaceae bacterium]HMX48617.1 peptidylprolyl isomerase [Cyclobacteriaceae bacterium]
MTRILLAAAFFMVCAAGFAQKKVKPAVLFTVGKEKVSADEFIYLYKKNHPAKEDLTEQKINEYLDLYINFKLKVTEARARGIDKTPEFTKEYTSYKDELRKPFLPESKILDSLVVLTYNRLQKEVSASHILIEVKQDATPEDTLQAYNTAVSLKKQILAGEDLGAKAALYSDDTYTKTRGGDLGYFTTLQMVSPFEEAVYGGKPGDVVGPVRTSFGYHIIKVGETRPARGEVEVSHIMLRTGNRDEAKNKALIFEIREKLNKGITWEDLVKQYSEDPGSKDIGGKLRPFGVGALAKIPEFDAVAFSLRSPGELSEPFQTAFGWHIVRLERKIPLPTLEESAPALKNRLARDPRVQLSKQALTQKLKRDYAFTENAAAKAKVLPLADSTLSKGKWKIPGSFASGKDVLITLQGKKTTAHDFLVYVQQNQRMNSMAADKYMELLYNTYAESMLSEAFEAKLIATNPEFEMLLKEYYEGILLFDIMEKEVWKKASDDSVGQRGFFDGHPELYKAGERVRATIYYSDSKDIIDQLSKQILANDSASVQEILKSKNVYSEAGTFQREDRPALRDIEWKPGQYRSQNANTYQLVVVSNMVAPGSLSFDDARASVISEYQNELEKNWLASLKKKYPVKVNDKTKKYVVEKIKS